MSEPSTIPVVEERLRIGKRQKTTDRVRLRKKVRDRVEVAEAWLQTGEAVIERVPINRSVDTIPDVREQDGVLIVPVVEEVMVVEKRLVLKEEIRIRRQQKTRRVRRPVRLRSEEASLEHLPVTPSQTSQEGEANMETTSQTSLSAGTADADNRIVAMFETYERACAARDDLLAAGIDRSRMDVVHRTAGETDASFDYDRNEIGIWAAIKRFFLPEEDTHLYAEGIGRGHAMLVVRPTAGERARVIQVLESYEPMDMDTHTATWRSQGWGGVYAGQAAAQRSTTGREEQVVPVVEEQLRVGKREVERGSVRVRSYLVEEPVREQVNLREERVEVERRPVDRPVQPGDTGVFRDRTVEVSATGEEAVVGKEARVKEEIVVRKEADQRTETVEDRVRRTKVDVQGERDKAVPAGTASRPTPKK